ncbi:hypothetical protein JJB11_22260 [Ramlibacter ginsenosidimutans]|uniref:Uncharacterized protein n=1 Tax=Ramlibacter ginsenosidimutans TaxID=502333 RepID=A0A934TXL9_9BURK|nr:hypothetical protein [Ramlibacter ginsenosidimutans]MBK6008830.1 hypothetical protein [Ramlibacter ginsenosidimutans]
MPNVRTPRGITPPAPGLEHEEPAFVPEEDIPVEEAAATRDERPARSPDAE